MMGRLGKRGLPLLIVMVMFFQVSVYGLDVQSRSAILIDTETGQVLYEKNSEAKRQMASTTKIMTYLLTMEAIDEGKIALSDRVKVSQNAARTQGSSYNLRANDVLTVSELISSMMIISANDSAVVLAEHVSGSVGTFVAKMNSRAKALGFDSAYFVNPNGMPLANQDQNKISAKDLALLSRYTINKYGNQLINITSQKQFYGTYRSFSKRNTNQLLRTTSYTDGLKTGYTDLAMHCLVSTAKVKGSNDNRFISVILGGRSSKQRFDDSKKMLEYGLSNFETQTVVKKGEVLGYSKINSDSYIPIELIAKETVSVLSPKNKNLSIDKEIIVENQDLREDVLNGGEIMATVKLRDGTELEVATTPRRGICIFVDDGQIICDPAHPLIQDGTTLVPLGKIVNQLGASIQWEPETKTIIGNKDHINFALTIGNKKAMINGSQIDLAASPVIVKGTTMVPIKFIAESLGMDITWDSGTRTVQISSETYLADIAQ